MSAREGSPPPFAYDGLDRVMHEKARLGVLTSLMSYPKGLAFNELKQLCGLTDGNLNRHLQVLVDAGLIESAKVADGSRAVTRCRLTREGRQRFIDYLEVLEKVVRDAAESGSPALSPTRHRPRHA